MKRILYLLFSALISTQAFAWGTDGHKIVAQIAEDKLTPKAKSLVFSVIGGTSLAGVSNWADQVKGNPEWQHTKDWHFIDIPDHGDYESIPHSESDIVYAITEVVRVLKSSATTPAEKKFALMFLVHFVGDIHQPLHVGRPDDRGGNSIKIVFQGRQTNLHTLWDSGIIRTQGMDYKEYVRMLETSAFDSNPDIPEFKFSEVIKEDMALRTEIYLFQSVQSGPIILDAEYLQRNINAHNSRLLLGGKRLAFILNSIYR